jgi:aspartate/methionine/tyrosine aminotransferase
LNLEPFRLERWLLKNAELDLGGGGVQKLTLGEVVDSLSFSQLMKYGRTDGSDSLKELVSEWYGGVEMDRILITSGTSEANLLVNYTLLEPGDRYLSENPQYEQTTGLAKSLGVKVDEFQLNEENMWRPNVDEIKEKITKKPKIIFIDNPNNPTGAVLSSNEMKAICDISEDGGAYVHCDNALRGSELNAKPAETPLKYTDKAIVTGSISKLGATSPRIGWVIADRDLIKRLWVTKDYTTLGHSALGEYIAENILNKRKDIIKRNLEISRLNLSTLENWIKQNSDTFTLEDPKAGFTGFPRYTKDVSSVKLCEDLLLNKGLLLSPGSYFGSEHHLRINTGSMNNTLVDGLNRLGEYMKH